MKLARSLNQYTGHLGGLLFLLAFSLFPVVSEAITLPSGFQEQTVFQGLTLPTVVRFAADGRIFVAEKSGKIKSKKDCEKGFEASSKETNRPPTAA